MSIATRKRDNSVSVYGTPSGRCYMFTYANCVQLPVARFASVDAMPLWIQEAVAVLNVAFLNGPELSGVGFAYTFQRQGQEYRMYELQVSEWRATCLD